MPTAQLDGHDRAPGLFGLRVVVGAWLAQLFTMGLIIGAYPVFLTTIEEAFGASRAQTSLGIPLVMLAGALVSPALGKWVDHGSPRLIMAAGALLMSFGFFLLSRLESLAMLALAWIGLVGLGQALLGVIPANTVLANWFHQRRALMVAVAGTGITVGAAVFPFVTELLIARSGWRSALFVLSVACLLIPAPAVLFCIIKSPALLGLNPDGAATPPAAPDESNIDINFFRDWRFWVAGTALACMPAVLMSFNTHIVAWAEHSLFGRDFGVSVLSATAITTALSSLLFGQVCDRLGAINTLRVALVIELCGWAIVMTATSEVAFFAGVIIFALGAGSFLPCQASLLAQLWPVQVFGRATGCVGLIVISGIFLLPTAIGAGFEHYGGYGQPMQWMFAVLVLPIALLTLLKARMAPVAPLPEAS